MQELMFRLAFHSFYPPFTPNISEMVVRGGWFRVKKKGAPLRGWGILLERKGGKDDFCWWLYEKTEKVQF